MNFYQNCIQMEDRVVCYDAISWLTKKLNIDVDTVVDEEGNFSDMYLIISVFLADLAEKSAYLINLCVFVVLGI